MITELSFKTAWLSTNYSCNNRCLWCYAGSDKEENQKKSMLKELAFQGLQICSDLGMRSIILIGGEPTLYPHLEDLISNAKQKNLMVSMVTNGRKLKKREMVQRLKLVGIDTITISIESPFPQTHDAITQAKGSYQDTILGLENCLKEDIKTTTETTISGNNMNEMREMVSFLKEKGLQKIMFNLCSPSLGKRDSIYAVSPSAGAKVIEELYLLGKSLGIDVHSVTPLPVCNLDQAVAREMIEKRLLNTSCHIFYGNNFVIDYNGDILPCVHFSGYPLLSLYHQNGSFKSAEEFKREYLEEGGIPARFKRALWRYPSTKCESDPYFGKCTGGCSIFWLTKYHPDKEIRGLPVERKV